MIPSASTGRARRLNQIAAASLIGLICLCLAWELRLAPLRPGGSWLALKAIPLLLPLFGILRGLRYTHQWASMLILAYFVEGVVRAMTDPGVGAALAAAEILLATAFFFAAVFYAHSTRAAG